MITAIPVETIVGDPAWLAHRYQPKGDLIGFLRVPRAERARVPFLTDANLAGCGAMVGQSRRAAASVALEPAPIAFLFHSAFCCSTLLANALDVPGTSSVLKEPVLLNDLSGWALQGAASSELRAVTRDALWLLARPFEARETVVVKPSNVVSALIPLILEVAPTARALFLHAPLETFIASVVAKGLEGRLWARELAWKLGRGGLLDFGFDDEARFRQTDLQVAAIAWLGQQRLFARLATALGPARVRTLNGEDLLARPAETLAALDALFGLGLGPERTAAMAAGAAFTRHAKSGIAFDAQARAAVHDAARAANADEIGKVVRWAEAVAAHASVPMALPASLLA